MLVYLLSIISFTLLHFLSADLMLDRVCREGIKIERYQVITKDGYGLGLYHLVPRNNSNKATSRSMLLIHGMVSSSLDYVLYMNSSAGYYFYNRGFDIWLGNVRGNSFSRNHTSLDPNKAEFWNFSWHEMGIYDLPAMIDFILAHSNQNHLIFVGHSQGGSAITVLLCERPEYNKKVASVHLLAGAVMVTDTKPLILTPLLKNINQLKKLFEKHECVEWFSSADFSKFSKILAELCTSSSISKLCYYILGLVMGPSIPNSFYDDIFLDIAATNPNGCSYLQFAHYGQNLLAGRFQKYDHGTSQNMQLYGSAKPPEYNMSNIKTKIHILYGTNDNLVKQQNIPVFVEKIKEFVIAVDKMDSFNHVDFIIGQRAQLIPPIILRVINQLE